MKPYTCFLSLLFLPFFFPLQAQDSLSVVAGRYYERAVQEPNKQDALFFYAEALDRYKDHFVVLDSDLILNEDYWNAASCAMNLGENAYLTTLIRTILDRIVSRSGVESEAYGAALQKAAKQCLLAGDSKQAWRLLRRSDEIFKKTGTGVFDGRDLDLWRDAVTSKAELYRNETRWSDALRLAERLLRVEKKEYARNPDNALNYQNALLLAGNIANDGLRFRKANKYSKEAFYVARPLIIKAFNQMSEAARDRYWRKNRESLSGSETPYFDYLLLSKGLLLKASKDFNDLVRTQGDSLALQLLSRLNLATISGAPVATLESIDQSLVDHLQSLGVTFSSEKDIVTQQDIQAAMNEDDLVIEFYAKKGSSFGAALLKKGWKEAEHVDCSSLLDGVWPREIIKHFPTTKTGRIFFSADGALNSLGIEYFPVGKQGLLAELFPVYRLSTTKEILSSDKENERRRPAGLYGGALYDLRQMRRQRVLDSLKTGNKRNWDRSVKDAPIPDSLYFGLRPLRNALEEIEAIDSILLFSGLPVDVQTGAYAMEESFKKYSPEENLLHLATHGLFVSASEVQRHPFFAGIYGANLESFLQDPLLRAGLYMSGTNQALLGAKGFYEDGVLTAKEISMMDLHGVELVVLSACETGLGEDSSDGLFGLQRAFKKAGVQAIVLTIRTVQDNSAEFLMRRLYENRYLIGLSLHDAFYSAVRQLRDWEDANQENEKSWDAFLLLDGYLPPEYGS